MSADLSAFLHHTDREVDALLDRQLLQTNGCGESCGAGSDSYNIIVHLVAGLRGRGGEGAGEEGEGGGEGGGASGPDGAAAGDR